MANNFIKPLTLLSFGILLTGFVFFKSGNFEKPDLYPSATLNLISDTPRAKKPDSNLIFNPEMISTSKSGIVLDQKIMFKPNDSVTKEILESGKKKSQKPKNKK